MRDRRLALRASAPAVLAGVCAAVLLAAAGPAAAEPFDHPLLNGTIAYNADDWAAADRVVADRLDDTALRTANVRDLLLTWDADSLYVGVAYQAFTYQGADYGLSVYFDCGLGSGVTSAADLDSFANNLALAPGRRIDLFVGNRYGAFATDARPLPQVRRVTGPDGATVNVSARATRTQRQGVPPPGTEARFPLYYVTEIGIPWDAIYGLGAGRVRPLAALRVVAVATSADAALNGFDSAPNNAGLDGDADLVTLANSHVSVVDADGDGLPDPAGASVAGAVALENDPGNLALTATATLRGWTGGELGAPLVTVVTAAGAAGYTLPRLPAGGYDITLSAPGYVPQTQAVAVAAGQALTGVDFALERATAISGTIAFLSGPGAAGTVTLRDEAGTALSSAAFPAAGGAFTLYALATGTYRVQAVAPTYVPAETTFAVTAGVDVAGIDLRLARQTEVSGAVSFGGGAGSRGIVRFATADGATLGEQDFFEAGGPFQFFTDTSGDYRLTATPTFPLPTLYLPADTLVTVARGTDLTGIPLRLPLKPRVGGVVAFAAGPGAAGRAIAASPATGEADTLAFPAAGGAFGPFFLAPGAWRVSLEAAGYVTRDTTFAIAAGGVYDLGALALQPVRATRLVLTDADGAAIGSVATTVSIPDSNFYFYAPVRLEARDAAGRRDLYDVDGRLAAPFALNARKLDDVSLPRGQVGFFAWDDTTAVASVAFTAGVARFLVRDDAVEILRVTAANGTPGAPTARVTVGFGDPQPAVIVLAADRDTLVADDVDEITVVAQLYDSANNPSRLPNVPVGFAVAPASTGRGSFRIPTVLTNADGRATAVLAARGAGTLQVTAAAAVAGRVLAVRAGDLEGPETLDLTAVPGPPSAWEIVPAAGATGLRDAVTVTARLVDALGNPAAQAGVPISFAVDPATLGALQPPAAVSDTAGVATARFVPSGVAGIVELGGTSAGYAVGTAFLRVRDALIAADPRYDAEPPSRSVFPPVDLTTLIVDNDADALLLDIPFASDWAGLQMHVLFETAFDAAGATSDPFVMPVNYGHAQRPDYALTSKYSANDYGDFRKWAGSGWQFWVPGTGQYTTDEAAPKNIQNLWTTKSPEGMTIRVPWAPLGGRPDSLRLELYVTQEDGGQKRSAFDSVPPDSTLDLDFDYLNPGPNDWAQALGPVTLHAWSRTYRVKTDFPPAPAVSGATALPATLAGGEPFVLRARVQDGGGGVGDVLADLSAIGGPAVARMYDDGSPAHGDQAAGDGFFSLAATVPLGSPGGELPLVAWAWDATNAAAAADTAVVDVTAAVEVIVHAEDPVGDDHGPNQTGQERKYYTYPTNSAFIPGCFDLASLDIYETTAVVGGEPVAVIAFRVGLADFPNPADPGRANWNPRYANINVEKIDIMIDSAPGGATFGLPNRRADFQAWDAWDYAIIMDGWYKAVVPSLGQNTAESWRQNALRDDRSITLVSDFDDDHVTALVAKEALGNPSADDIRKWDVCVAISGHDLGNDEQDMGATRWVNESRSEWNFGGGYAGDRDANLIDLLLAPGVGRSPGRPQEELLDYESTQAVQRLEDGLTPCAIEVSAFEDTGPPVVRLSLGAAEVLTRTPLADAPIAFTVEITDDFLVDRAELRYRPAGFAGGEWAITEPMGYAGNDLWTVDLMPEWLDENLVVSPVDGARYLEFQVAAWDALDKTAASPVLTMRVDPGQSCLGELLPLPEGTLSLRAVDGTVVTADAALTALLAELTDGEPWEGPPPTADSLSFYAELCAVAPALAAAPSVPAGRALGVFRGLRAAVVDETGAIALGRLPAPYALTLHYPQAWVPEGLDENRIGLYEYQPRAGRWVLVGGNVNTRGNNVTVNINRTGLFGLFWSADLDYDAGEVVSGIVVSPNPFSPNDDGLYDETTISFYLSQEATVSVEIYNIEGKRQQVITETFPFSGEDDPGRAPRRVAGLSWDGRDQAGDAVPYGVYILRLMVTYNQAGGTRTVRSTHPVAVIR